MSTVWQINLFGGLGAVRGQENIERFRSHNIAALLAYLCLFPRQHSREELAELFWPDADIEAGRVNLRTAIASLRRQFEKPGDAAVLAANGYLSIGLNPAAVVTDAAMFERVALSAQTAAPDARLQLLTQAAGLYTGPLLPGFYETWVLNERDRLAEIHFGVLRDLARIAEQAGNWEAALDYARRAVTADSLREEAHAELIRLLVASGQRAAARKQFAELERLLRDELDVAPGDETRVLLDAEPVAILRFAPAPAAPEMEDASLPGRPVQQAPRLPLTLTRFFGRGEEVESLAHLLRSGMRLVTLTGPGGCGKTRLSIETARLLGDAFSGGISFIPLADLRNPEDIPDAIADALGLARSPNVPPMIQVGDALRRMGPSLFVLDNFEQLVDGGAQVVQTLLDRSANVACLVTSRQCLSVDGEQEYPLHPLPSPETPGSPERLLEYPSVQLFVNRAQSVRPDFRISAHNATAIALLCARLEGMPLAVELAAAWAKTLTPAQLLTRLGQRFELLVSRRRDIPDRHQTLRATLAWSFQLLPPDTQTFFAQMSVFRGGWTLQAAEHVTQDLHALEHLTTLREHSLVLAEPVELQDGTGDIGMRYRMLETLREFAQEIADAGPERTELYRRHFEYFRELAEVAGAGLLRHDQAQSLLRLNAERDNFRAALTWSLGADPEAALRMTSVLTWYWEAGAQVSEGSAWLERALDAHQEPTLLRADMLSRSARMFWYMQDWEPARQRLKESVELYRSLDNDPGIAYPLTLLGGILLLNDVDVEGAREVCAEAWAITERSRDMTPRLELLEWRAFEACIRECYDEGEEHAAAWLAEARTQGHRIFEGAATFWQGLNIANSGDYDRSIPYFERAIEILEPLGDIFWAAGAWFGLGIAMLLKGDLSRAKACERRSLQLMEGTGFDYTKHYVPEALAYILAAEGNYVEAARILGAVNYIRQTGQTAKAPLLGKLVKQFGIRAREVLGAEAFDREYAAGAAMNLAQTMEYAVRAAGDPPVGL